MRATEDPLSVMSQPPNRLPATTAMDAVMLHVRDLPGMLSYYRDALALTVLDERGEGVGHEGRGVVELGRGSTPLVTLRHTPNLPPGRARDAGLFHTALLFDREATLAATAAAALRHAGSRFVGSADHLVSESFYFADPEDNQIELYRDRPRSAWTWSRGRVEIAVLPMDPGEYLGRHLTDAAVADPAAARAEVGHVHLKVGDLARAREFYVDTLGFEVKAEMPGALFVAAGDYHHHLALNTWQSRGAGPRAATLGLGRVAITVSGRADLDALVQRLRDNSVPVRDDGATVCFDDPWRSAIEVRAAAPGSAGHRRRTGRRMIGGGRGPR